MRRGDFANLISALTAISPHPARTNARRCQDVQAFRRPKYLWLYQVRAKIHSRDVENSLCFKIGLTRTTIRRVKLQSGQGTAPTSGDSGVAKLTKVSQRTKDTVLAWVLGVVTTVSAAASSGVFHQYIQHEAVADQVRRNSAQLSGIATSVRSLDENVAVLTATVTSQLAANQRERDALQAQIHDLQTRADR